MSESHDDAERLREMSRARAPYVIVFGIVVVALSVIVGLHGVGAL